jgi:hypothetical protein
VGKPAPLTEHLPDHMVALPVLAGIQVAQFLQKPVASVTSRSCFSQDASNAYAACSAGIDFNVWRDSIWSSIIGLTISE